MSGNKDDILSVQGPALDGPKEDMVQPQAGGISYGTAWTGGLSLVSKRNKEQLQGYAEAA